MNYQQNYKVFSPKNLVGQLLIRWKLILAVSVITACVGGVIGYSKTRNNNSEPAAPQYASDVERTAAALTEEQKAEGDKYYSRILKYDKSIEEQENFNENCYTMSLDPEKAVGYYMRYLLETDIGNAGNYYNNYIISEDDYKELSDLLPPECGKAGLNEAFSISTNTADPDPSYKLDLERTTRLSGEVESKYKMIVTAYIWSPDKETCDGIAKIVDNAIARKTDALRTQKSVTACTFIDSGYDDGAKLSVTNRKRDKVNAVVALVNGKASYIVNMLTNVNPNVKAYVNALMGIPAEIPADSGNKEAAPSMSLWEYILLGLLSGLVLCICAFSLVYALGGKIHTPEDISGYLGIPVLRTIPPDTLVGSLPKTDIVTGWGKRIIGAAGDGSDPFEILSEEMDNIANAENVRQIYVAADGASDGAMMLADRICAGAHSDISYVVGKMIPDADDMKKMLASEGVIILPVMDKTKMKSIATFTDICRRNNKKVLGSVPSWE